MLELGNERFKSLKDNEVFSAMRIPLKNFFFIRLDGRRFSRLCEKLGADRPYDARLARCLVKAVRAVYSSNFTPALAYVCSDEINLLFLSAAPFSGRVEKINSVFASLISSAFTIALFEEFKKLAISSFDSRIAVTPGELPFDYLAWRQSESVRNHLNSYAFWTLIKHGFKGEEAAKKLEGLKAAKIKEILNSYGVNPLRTPVWQRRGIVVYRQPIVKTTKVAGKIIRMKLTENWEPPSFLTNEGRKLIEFALSASLGGNYSREKRNLNKD
jgi:tRNA(His) 5'-end guanylyltransferase